MARMASLLLSVLFCLSLMIGEVYPSVALDSSLVFNPTFYINAYYDLRPFKTVAAAKHHWLTHGINEGRRASGRFHSVQYLQRYPDLTKAFGKNYREAVTHFLTYGQTEKRLGYVEGGAAGWWTVSNAAQTLFISTSERNAGAIDSLVWNKKEFLNSWDHARSMQMTMHSVPHQRCFGPTEAGSSGDQSQSTSRLISVNAHGTTIETRSHPAFWLSPGAKDPGSCGLARNTETLYGYEFSKNVTIGCVGLDTCIKYVSRFTLAGYWPRGYEGIKFGAPGIHMANDFSVFLNYDVNTKQLHAFEDSSQPVVMATHDGQFAMGLYAPSGQSTDYEVQYHAKSFGGNFASGTHMCSVFFRKYPIPACTTDLVTFTAYLCVGSKATVASCLAKVHESFTSSQCTCSCT